MTFESKPRGLLIALAVAVLFFLMASSGCRKRERVGVGSKAPEFTLKDTEGNPRSLSSLKGKVVLLEFWATWCAPCEESVPNLNRIYELFGEKPFEILAVSLDEGQGAVGKVKDFGSAHKVGYPLLHDDKNVAGAYGIYSIPNTFLIDKGGVIRAHHMGFSDDMVERFSKKIEELLR